MASGWHLLNQDGLIVLRECQALGIKVHIAGTFATGLLAGGFTYVYQDAPAEMLSRAKQWSKVSNTTVFYLPRPAPAWRHAAALCPQRVLAVLSSCCMRTAAGGEARAAAACGGDGLRWPAGVRCEGGGWLFGVAQTLRPDVATLDAAI